MVFCNYVDEHQYTETYLAEICYYKEWHYLFRKKITEGFYRLQQHFLANILPDSPVPSHQKQPHNADS